jgi:alcohol dehydrogenase
MTVQTLEYTFVCPVKTHCGVRALEHIPYELETHGACKPMILCDAPAARENRLKPVADAMRGSKITCIAVDLPPGDAAISTLHQLAAIYRDKDCDAILALGGGEMVNIAKLLNLMISTGSDSLAAMDGVDRIPGRLKPLAVIPPAEAGGFETAGYAALGANVFQSVHLMPALLFLDARTVGRPAVAALAETAFTALALGAEPYVYPRKNPMADIYAANAVQMAAGYLQSYSNPSATASTCLTVANAAAMGGCSLGFGPKGLVFSLAQHIAKTGRLKIGAAMGLLLPYVMGFGARHRGWQIAELLLPMAGIDTFTRTPTRQRTYKTLEVLCSMVNGWFDITQGQFPRTLAEAGFAKDELATLAEGLSGAEADARVSAGREILQLAWQGQPYPH